MNPKPPQHNIKDINILNWNANGIKTQTNLFTNYIQKHQIHISCITETHLAINEQFRIPGYTIYRQDRRSRVASGGVAMIIKNQIKHHLLPEIKLNTLECVGIETILIDNSKIKIYAMYRPPNSTLQEKDLKKIFNTNNKILALGDYNSKNTIWGCRVTNPNEVLLNELSTKYNFQILAPTNYTFFPYQTDYQPDILDILLLKNCNKPLTQSVTTELDSDHLSVIISLSLKISLQSSQILKHKTFRNFELFQTTLNKNLKSTFPLQTKPDIDSSILTYTETIQKTIE
jgi:Endonuclease-reverse transcriptase